MTVMRCQSPARAVIAQPIPPNDHEALTNFAGALGVTGPGRKGAGLSSWLIGLCDGSRVAFETSLIS
jgi:hypothetical protein